MLTKTNNIIVENLEVLCMQATQPSFGQTQGGLKHGSKVCLE